MNKIIKSLSLGISNISSFRGKKIIGNNKGFNFEGLDDFDNHKSATFIYDPLSGLRGFIVIHRGGIVNPAFGATRIWGYPSEEDALIDALRLSRGMSYKSAMAGLNYGGAKAVIISPSGYSSRKHLLKTYTQWVNCLNGRFITGADVGVSDDDLKVMLEEGKYVVGGQSDPVKFTALGVLYGIRVCLNEVFGDSSIVGRTFAIQGVGKTGMGLLRLIYDESKKIYVADVDNELIGRVKEGFPKVEVVSPSEIYQLKVDVFSPCALSHEVNFKNVSSFNCKIIAGSANNQLEKREVGELLHKLGILYAPDYVINAGGLITVVDEYEHTNSNEKRVERRVAKIKNTMKAIIEKSKRLRKATNVVADEMAEKIFHKFI